jgi:hypothetical protein
MGKKSSKKFYESKSFWVGTLQVVGGVALALSDYVSAGGVLTLSGVLQIVLRAVSKTEIKFK